METSRSKRAVTTSLNCAEASSIFPNSSMMTTPPTFGALSPGSASFSNAGRSTPYFPTRGGPGRSTCASTARFPRTVSTAKPIRRFPSRISSVVKPLRGTPCSRSNSTRRRAMVVLPMPGLPSRRNRGLFALMGHERVGSTCSFHSIAELRSRPRSLGTCASLSSASDMDRFIHRLIEICAPDRVITNRHALQAYESDGLLQYATVPKVVVLPDTAEEVRTVVRACFEEGIPWVVRGSGTGLSGGALPLEEGVVIALTRMRRIVEVDLRQRGRELRRSALLQVRIHHELRHRPGGGAIGRRCRDAGRKGARSPRVRPGGSVRRLGGNAGGGHEDHGARGPCPGGETDPGRLLRDDRSGWPDRLGHRGGSDRPGRDRDDGSPLHPGERGSDARGLFPRGRGGSHRRAGWAAG